MDYHYYYSCLLHDASYEPQRKELAFNGTRWWSIPQMFALIAELATHPHAMLWICNIFFGKPFGYLKRLIIQSNVASISRVWPLLFIWCNNVFFFNAMYLCLSLLYHIIKSLTFIHNYCVGTLKFNCLSLQTSTSIPMTWNLFTSFIKTNISLHLILQGGLRYNSLSTSHRLTHGHLFLLTFRPCNKITL